MSTNFDESLPTDLDKVRAAIADRGSIVDAEGQPVWLRQDEEIQAVLDRPLDWRLAAAEIGTFLAVELAQRVDSYTDESGMSVRWSKRTDVLLAMAKMLRDQVAGEQSGSGSEANGGIADVHRHEHRYAEYVRRPSWLLDEGW